jgi:hypothetical protein
MVKVVFIEDFATKVKGDIFECDGQLASQLIHEDKVAEYYQEKSTKVESDEKEEKKKPKKDK